MIRVIVAVLGALVIAGCATSQPGEQSTSLSERVLARQRTYCTETSPVTRAAALALIRAQVPGYPASGLCTDAEQALAAEIARQLEDLPEGATIDIEQAREDQRRFQEQGDADTDTQPAPDVQGAE
ncbi:hypothetical protein [Halomonas lysinitropha]|uniref:Lipoprotein n=1 Tax=Halomonas lysinitropha TaxID=2607506 RepID=A0A5K1I8J2_9GAMM|nr:hypothetical protein [Halomonas lysinitropha]VVZ96493.1 hypothetical protein HALO32_02594 [Halomonas lysinitropha]